MAKPLKHNPLKQLYWQAIERNDRVPVAIKTNLRKAILRLQDTGKRGQDDDLQAQIANCRSPEDYFDFSDRYLKSMQIREEILAFIEFARSTQLDTICEIGIAHGGTHFLLGRLLPSVSLSIGIDLYVKQKSLLRQLAAPDRQSHYIDGLSQDPKTIAKVECLLNGKKIDLLFIDGDHSYNGVRGDFFAYRHLVAENGIVVFHDIVPDYNARYGISTPRYTGGVPQFYQEIQSFYPSQEFVNNREQDGYGIGTIRYSHNIDLSALG